jgi:phenylalanyl-tRNA synthetase alpha chain
LEIKNRLRPSYFPFTEPSAEVDIYWGLKPKLIIELPKEPVGDHGCGMVDLMFLKCGINPEEYTVLLWNGNEESLCYYQIGDIRMFYENDVRFLEQFKATI